MELTVKPWGVWLRGRWAEVYWPWPKHLLQGLKEALELQGKFSGLDRLMAWRVEDNGDGIDKKIMTIYTTATHYILVCFSRGDEDVKFLVPRDRAEEMVRILSQSLSESYDRAAS